MTENDLIAEYVKEKHPQLLGVDFALWKVIRKVREAASIMLDAFSNLTPEDIEALQGENSEEGN